MSYVLIALALSAGVLWSLRGGLTSKRRNGTIVGFDQQSLVLGGLAVLAAGVMLGPQFGLALIVSVAIHEFGHVAAYRVCGHDDARFRLIPLLGGVAISDRMPATQEKDFFITLMGPAICIAPALLTLSLVPLVFPYWPQGAIYLWAIGSLTGALNTFNLLPFWPLDGGRMTHILARIYWPAGARYVAIAMSAIFAAFALYSGAIILFVFALIGAQSLTHAETISRLQRPMSRKRGLIALFAYLATLAVHMLCGGVFLARYL